MQKSTLYLNFLEDGKIANFDQSKKNNTTKNNTTKKNNGKNNGKNNTKKITRNRKKMTKTKDIDLYVVRVDCKGKLTDSKPCNHCLDAMKRVGIKKVFYSTSSRTIICEKVSDMISDHISHGQKVLKLNKPILHF